MASDMASGSAVRRTGMGSVPGLKSFEGLLGGAGEGEDEILRRREKSSWSASAGAWCLRGEAGEGRAAAGRAGGGRGERAGGGGGGGGRSRVGFALGKKKDERVWGTECCATDPSVRRLRAVSLASRSVGWSSRWWSLALGLRGGGFWWMSGIVGIGKDWQGSYGEQLRVRVLLLLRSLAELC